LFSAASSLFPAQGARKTPVRETSNFMNRIKTVAAFKMRPQK
jgi:hypothetical protein